MIIPSDAEIIDLLNKLDRVLADERHLVLSARGFIKDGDGEKTDDELIEGDGL